MRDKVGLQGGWLPRCVAGRPAAPAAKLSRLRSPPKVLTKGVWPSHACPLGLLRPARGPATLLLLLLRLPALLLDPMLLGRTAATRAPPGPLQAAAGASSHLRARACRPFTHLLWWRLKPGRHCAGT